MAEDSAATCDYCGEVSGQGHYHTDDLGNSYCDECWQRGE